MKDENPIIVSTNSLERRVDRTALSKLFLIPQDRKLRNHRPRLGRQLGCVVRARIIPDENSPEPRNTRTRLKRAQGFNNRIGRIEGWDDDSCAYPITLT